MRTRHAMLPMLLLVVACSPAGQLEEDDEGGTAQGELSDSCSVLRARYRRSAFQCAYPYAPACEAAEQLEEQILAECPCGLDPRPALDYSQRNPEATLFDGQPVRGVDILTIYYCSDSGSTRAEAETPHSDYRSAPSVPEGCDYHACVGQACQQNLCRPTNQ